jgi:hypothetical protein
VQSDSVAFALAFAVAFRVAFVLSNPDGGAYRWRTASPGATKTPVLTNRINIMIVIMLFFSKFPVVLSCLTLEVEVDTPVVKTFFTGG